MHEEEHRRPRPDRGAQLIRRVDLDDLGAARPRGVVEAHAVLLDHDDLVRHAASLRQSPDAFGVGARDAGCGGELDGARCPGADQCGRGFDELRDALAHDLLELHERNEAARRIGHGLSRLGRHHRAGQRGIGAGGVDQRPDADVAVALAVVRRQKRGVKVVRTEAAGGRQRRGRAEKRPPFPTPCVHRDRSLPETTTRRVGCIIPHRRADGKARPGKTPAGTAKIHSVRGLHNLGLASFLLLLASARAFAQDPAIAVDEPMAPPAWALLERTLLDANSRAVEEFAERYMDARGYLLHTPRWGTLDGPDDAIETYFNWTLLHALGGSDRVLDLYRLGLEGHLQQYGELRTELTTLAENGAYSREFITQSDWFHTGEGMRGFLLYGLADPHDPVFVDRMTRFARMYMGDDPLSPNYDPEKKLIKSIWTGSQGPMLHDATTYDWVGDPVPGTFHILHSPDGRDGMLDLEQWYPRMLAHCEEYLDSVGDHPLNMGATLLGLNAFMLTGEDAYRDWVVEYIDAWRARTAMAGGMIPSNVGLNGEPGGEYDGQWWKGTYGWNFTIFDGEIRQIGHRNTVMAGAWPGFSNAYLLTGDQRYVDVLRKQLDLLYDNAKVEGGRTLLPQMYGDPQGYKHSGEPEFYHYTPNLYTAQATKVYLWSMDRADLARVPAEQGWIAFLEGNDPEYPERALREDLDTVRAKVEQMRSDPTSPDTRLADWLLGIVPPQTDALTELMTGGYLRGGKLWALHARLRYFDPVRRRAGVPPGVGALVEKLTADAVTVTLVNLDPVDAREVVVQAGAYAEHQLTGVERAGERTALDSDALTVRLAPGAGATLTLTMERYANPPTLAQPWDR